MARWYGRSSPDVGDCGLKKQPARRSAASRSSVSTSLHRAKLRRPATPSTTSVARACSTSFDEVVRNRLTLVVAPAGTGKTSLVAGWMAESSTPTAWLSLDDTDRDGVQFWSAVIAALDTLAPGCGDRAAGDAATSRQPGRRGGPADRRSGGRGPTAGGARHRRLPPRGRRRLRARVGVALRAQPAGLAPRRPDVAAGAEVADRSDEVARQLGEIRFAELRFSPDEAVELMTRLSPALSAERIEAAVQRADGWAASLQLAALAARSRRAQTPRAGARSRGRRARAGLRAARGAGERGTRGDRRAVRGGGGASGQPEPRPGADRSPGRR